MKRLQRQRARSVTARPVNVARSQAGTQPRTSHSRRKAVLRKLAHESRRRNRS